MARPTKYNKAILETAKSYLEDFRTEHAHSVPSVAGLGKVLRITRETLYQWAEDEDKKEFSDTLAQIMSDQEFELQNGGLNGSLNSNITKLMLFNHGHSEKQDQKMSGAIGVADLSNKSDEELEAIVSGKA